MTATAKAKTANISKLVNKLIQEAQQELVKVTAAQNDRDMMYLAGYKQALKEIQQYL